MDFKKPSEQTIKFLDEKLINFNAQRKKMFGSPVYFVNNNMFSGVYGDDIFIRLNEENQKEFYSKFSDTTKFSPMGKTMKEYVVIPKSLYDNENILYEWFNISFNFVLSLPTKEKKLKRKS
ncbi:MAG: hypothetical protein A2086_04620 [Spirochaetes bacterium GWD1_27_9]|nr:MAG: hypothetical protein A2Z98_13710 [Spirochaetes bacterium GWB1_27_13]OHD25846.1 MAG: hypothetical protein A2Y34_03430 [Spirochaetes bacterium GWC1_27_15]OHD30356.1 MAG: hypothetical protein A2086_04620 [Spirochaetes bacterium GWD1_27_9]